jgi:hypothetical protein
MVQDTDTRVHHNRKKNGKVQITKRPISRQWRATSQSFYKMDVFPVEGATGNTYMLCFKKKKDENGIIPDNFAIFPKWNVIYRGNSSRLDQIQILNLLRDTFWEFKPTCTLRYNNRQCVGRVTGFHGTVSDDPLYEKYKRHYYFILNFETNVSLPKQIKKPFIILQSKLLPKPRYEYGFCNLIDAAYNPCTDEQYLKAPNMTLYSGNSQCMAFDMTKGNPHQYCSFSTGT